MKTNLLNTTLFTAMMSSALVANAADQVYLPDQQCLKSVASTAPSLRFIDNQDGTVKDTATGLTWMRCQIGQTWNKDTITCDGTADEIAWTDAITAAKDARDTQGNRYYQFAGYSDWRLPNIKELTTIVERRCANPTLDNATFPRAMAFLKDQAYRYVWSSTSSVNRGGLMYMDITAGDIGARENNAAYKGQAFMVSNGQKASAQ